MSVHDYKAQTLNRWILRRENINVKLTMYVNKVVQKTNLTVAARVKIAGAIFRDAVVVNLSRPVRKLRRRSKITTADGASQVVTRTYVDPESRSKPGEFPRADTTRLMKSIFHKHDEDTATSLIGTNLAYGLILETRLDRSFLRRTMNEKRAQILLIVRGHQP